MWVQYISFEHEIENHKRQYFSALRNCQALRPNENISEWVGFFLKSLLNLQVKLDKKLELKTNTSSLPPREKSIYLFILSNSGCKSGEISEKLDIPNPTTKRILSQLVKDKLIEKYGKGAGVNYAIKLI